MNLLDIMLPGFKGVPVDDNSIIILVTQPLAHHLIMVSVFLV